MTSTQFTITLEQFLQFHAIDRELYKILVSDVWRDPLESMQIMAFWLSLERMGSKNVIKKILSLPHILINELADEAGTCLNCINNDQFLFSSEPCDIPLTQCVTENEVCLQFFHENRVAINRGVNKVLTQVCYRALTDIMQKAIQRNAALSLAESQMPISSPPCHQSFVQPGISHSVVGGSSGSFQGWTQANVVPQDDRTMFVTFSKGYPVSEWEVREFFTLAYGDCIESVLMQDVPANEQALFARIVFHMPSTIEIVLNGLDKAKFTINGKHVWVRKYVPKRPRSAALSPMFPQNLPGTV
ncbi:uncharacterized protein LOC132277046 [Cornus florida]|uniref:uncharacterized protein LOC132277046 n=1 Tax=Cornus florida TaxID=4283 RepID=UPI002898AAE6|nr:uncharacterized protein LOC132277046 [Cornus florida]